MLEKYNRAVEKILSNDKNSSIDTLLKEVDNDLNYAYMILKSILNNLIEDTEESEREFYQGVLMGL